MSSLRVFFRDHRRLAALLVALALCVKGLVPAGFMLGGQGKVLTVTICAGATGHRLTEQIVLPDNGKSGDHAKNQDSCPYGALGMAALTGADAALLALALAFIFALGFAPVHAPEPRRTLHLRPPLRGPPVFS